MARTPTQSKSRSRKRSAVGAKHALLKRRYQVLPSVLFKRDRDPDRASIQVVDMRGGRFFDINGLAATFFQHITGEKTAGEILGTLVEGSPEGETVQAATQFLEDLLREGLIEVANP